jgi:MFS family permease
MFEMFRSLGRRQWMILVVFALCNFCQAICVSLQAPFYPKEAEKKGATATEYGLVFGIFELTVFIASPFIGTKLNGWGARRVFNLGIFTTGTCSILFGMLDHFEDPNVFIGMSFLVRTIEALGNAAFLTASFTIIAREFPDNVGAMFATLETFFGMGLIAGPTIGGALYQIGGYFLPFVTLGCGILMAATVTYFLLPVSLNEADSNEGGTNDRMIDLFRVPTICLSVLSILCASSSIGFLLTTLEPHMRQFNLNPVTMGEFNYPVSSTTQKCILCT